MAITSCKVKFVDIKGGTGSLPEPNDERSVLVDGLKKDSVVFARVEDVSSCLKCSLSGSSTNMVLQRNGQILELVVGSKTMKANFGYFVKNYQTGKQVSYSFQWLSTLPAAPFVHTDGKRYVPVDLVAMQLGALITGTYNSVFTVYDFRVGEAGNNPDNNTYIVGGSWVTNWSTISGSYLAPHFKINELFSKGSGSSYRQLKVAVSLLTSLEAVRHAYRDDGALKVFRAFRSWEDNRGISGSWDRSFHMRGRAYDIASGDGGTALYSDVYKEFCGTASEPLHTGAAKPYGFWKTRVANGASGGYEIETMPRGSENTTWLHLQVKPGCEEQN
ncbi:MAG: D-Ala-D-Ala carboxypeptidase family metallohydrolase [Lachnospiraceae bacterium]|nr:D-Ala-D-Ala carboxypeptidase family metallohydrolase [Lachnospiraceae bacterium]